MNALGIWNFSFFYICIVAINIWVNDKVACKFVCLCVVRKAAAWAAKSMAFFLFPTILYQSYEKSMLVCLLIAQIEVEYTMRLYLYVYDGLFLKLGRLAESILYI